MKKTAERYIKNVEAEPMTNQEVVASVKKFHHKYSVLLILAALSIVLYAGLYYFSGDIVAMAKSTYTGSKGMFFVPILLALIFSIIHGAFTSKFWDVLGVKAKQTVTASK